MSKNIVITGASSGIGKSIFSHLSSNHHVYGSYYQSVDNEDKLIQLNLSDSESIQSFVAELKEKLGNQKINSLISNAGITLVSPLTDLSAGQLEEILKVNVMGPVELIKQLLPLMASNSRIIIIGSISGSVTFPFMGAYSASKSALKSISKALRMELAQLDIQVTLIEPGNIKTPIWDDFFNGQEELLNKSSPIYRATLENGFNLARQKYESADEVHHFSLFVEKLMRTKKLKAHYFFGKDAKRTYLLSKILPYNWFEYFIKKKYGLKK